MKSGSVSQADLTAMASETDGIQREKHCPDDCKAARVLPVWPYNRNRHPCVPDIFVFGQRLAASLDGRTVHVERKGQEGEGHSRRTAGCHSQAHGFHSSKANGHIRTCISKQHIFSMCWIGDADCSFFGRNGSETRNVQMDEGILRRHNFNQRSEARIEAWAGGMCLPPYKTPWVRVSSKISPLAGCSVQLDTSSLNLNKWVFPKKGIPKIIHFNRVFHYKPSILGYPYFETPKSFPEKRG